MSGQDWRPPRRDPAPDHQHTHAHTVRTWSSGAGRHTLYECLCGEQWEELRPSGSGGGDGPW